MGEAGHACRGWKHVRDVTVAEWAGQAGHQSIHYDQRTLCASIVKYHKTCYKILAKPIGTSIDSKLLNV